MLHSMMGARRWLVYAGMIRILRPTAQSIDVQLPWRLTEILYEFDRIVWPADASRKIGSVYSNLALIKQETLNDEEATMGSF